MKGLLYLIPTTLGDNAVNDVIPFRVSQVINEIDYYIVENERSARRYLKKLGIIKEIDQLHFYVIDKHNFQDVSAFLKPLEKGLNMGLLSEAGCPAVADPGSEVVKVAHQMNIRVIPLVGPSSIMLSLMASGLNGQSFAFHGYLPIKKDELTRKLKSLETRSQQEKQTQIFIETPYRNHVLLDELFSICHPNTMLTIACDLTLETEFVKTHSIKDWKTRKPDINKHPAIFLIHKF